MQDTVGSYVHSIMERLQIKGVKSTKLGNKSIISGNRFGDMLMVEALLFSLECTDGPNGHFIRFDG